MATSALEAAPRDGLHPRRRQALALLATAQFMLILDVTVVAIALPRAGAELDLSREALTWVVTAYTVTFGGLMLLGGRLADLCGPGRIVHAGLLVFTAGSLTAGLAEAGTLLLTGRVAQGLGAALLSPAALSVVVRMFVGEERTRALGVWSALGGGGAAVGVLLGGLLTAGPGWPWVFFVNVPVGVVVLVGLRRVLPALPPTAGPRPALDLLGALLVTAATGSAIFAVTASGDQGPAGRSTLLAAGAALLLYVLFGWRQRSARSPLMDLGLLTRRPVGVGMFVILVATALMVAVFFLGTFHLQRSAGHGPLATGLLFLPVAVATMSGANLGARLLARLGARALGATGMAIAAVGLLAPALWATTAATTAGMSLGAFGIGALFVVASATALGRVGPEEAGVASGLLSTFHELGASVGVATVSSVAATSLVAGGGDTGFQHAFAVTAGAAALAAAVSLVAIPPGPRRDHPGRRTAEA